MTTLFHSIIGLPASGKTTYLAALWHLLDAGEVSTSLVLDKLVGDHEYLNKIVASWRRCDEVPRTSMTTETQVSIHMRVLSTDQRIILSFSDLSGESFERQFAGRTCSPQYVAGYENEGGVLLFVNADRPSDGITLLDLNPIVVEAKEQPHAVEQLKEWSPKLAPQQTRLVDLLQFLLRPPFFRRRRRVAVIVSAWDVVPLPRLSPSDWLARELPLLSQFLQTNSKSFEWRAYGISAQGGDVSGRQKIELLRKVPSSRIVCVGDGTTEHDITAPLLWLSEGVH